MNIEKIQNLYSELIDTAQLNEWQRGYRETINHVNIFRKKIESGSKINPDHDKEFLSKLLKDKTNGVASRGQSTLKNDHFDLFINNSNFLGLVEKLILIPTHINHLNFRSYCKERLAELKTTQVSLIFNRATASCTLDLCPVVDELKFKKLFHYLRKQGLLNVSSVENQDWYIQNKFIAEQFKIALPNKDTYLTNILPWLIYQKEFENK
ncbi:hypothetical protein [Acinetobacter pollinis]|uniref:DUF2913 family protein n=1 Tax=Acinetobacter pollinis TaxID=2605270 RepID=A0ABU6DUP1_9GAMM|nr:hypothetical protein [Acinetobacter pollinis]MEB5477553.1 hypothetical protein [Acinetobacter pollinis]